MLICPLPSTVTAVLSIKKRICNLISTQSKMITAKTATRLIYVAILLITSGTLTLLIMAYISIKNVETTSISVENKSNHNTLTLSNMQHRDSIKTVNDSIKYTKLLNIVNGNVTILSKIIQKP